MSARKALRSHAVYQAYDSCPRGLPAPSLSDIIMKWYVGLIEVIIFSLCILVELCMYHTHTIKTG